MSDTTTIDKLLAGIEAAAIPVGLLRDDVIFDATVPNWRYTLAGAEVVRAELAKWYAEPGHFQDLRRTPLPDGELIEFTLQWREQDVPHMCHQAHILHLREGQVAEHTAWCGGRWPASLIAQMQATA